MDPESIPSRFERPNGNIWLQLVLVQDASATSDRLDGQDHRIDTTSLSIPPTNTSHSVGEMAAVRAGSSTTTASTEASNPCCAISPASKMNPHAGTSATSCGKPQRNHDSPANEKALTNSPPHFLKNGSHDNAVMGSPKLQSSPVSPINQRR